MSVIERLRQARNVDQIAEEIEPLVQAMAALSDELSKALGELKTAVSTSKGAIETSTGGLNKATGNATKTANDIKQLFEDLVEAQRNTAWKLRFRTLLFVSVASLAGGAGAGIGLWVWRSPSKETEIWAKRWGEVATAYNGLPPAKRKQFCELMGWPEPKAEATGRSKR